MHAAPGRCMQLLHGRVNNPETGPASMTTFPVALSLVIARRHRVTWDVCFTRHRARQTVYARNKHTFRGHRASDARETLVETVTVDDEASAAYILWKNYAAARRHVLTMMRERGEQLNPQKLNTLRALLQHYGLDLSDEVAGRPDVNAGTLLFPAEYYDAERVRSLLSCMSAYVWPGSSVIARVGERHVKIRFGYSEIG